MNINMHNMLHKNMQNIYIHNALFIIVIITFVNFIFYLHPIILWAYDALSSYFETTKAFLKLSHERCIAKHT